jgi:hypothetical protein
MSIKTQIIATVFRSQWSFSRWLRLAIGLAIAYSAYRDENGLVAALALFLVFQALSNTGCASANCSIPANHNAESEKVLPSEKHH